LPVTVIASLYVLKSFFFALKVEFKISSLSFMILSWSKIRDKLAVYWQNFARGRLQLKFSFIIYGPKLSIRVRILYLYKRV